MPNSYFKFKQFIIHQDKCAMKVCTDACLFGAWAADRLPFTVHRSPLTPKRVLDIGTGTGLLSLMLAQKNQDTIIDAVEIDAMAAQQAKENFEASPWKERLNVYTRSIQQFTNARMHELKYDIIVSNPPFYEGDLKSKDAKRNLALHSAELMLEELINIADALLKEDGSFFVLLPAYRMNDLEALIKEKFFIKEKVLVKPTEAHDWFRGIWWLVKKDMIKVQSEIIINGGKNYSNDFNGLLKDYYLKL